MANIGSIARHLKLRFFPHPILRVVKPHTLLTPDRLDSLLTSARSVTRHKRRGAFVECGTFRGGSAAILAFVAKQEGWKRDLYLFDSFQGHPEFASARAPDRAEMQKWTSQMVASEEDVRTALRCVGAYDPAHVHIIPGWFQESIPSVNIPEIALLHLDADWYDSILFCLEALFGHVISDGIIQIDDYSYYEGCRLAVDEFLSRRKGLRVSKVGVAVVIRKKQCGDGSIS